MLKERGRVQTIVLVFLILALISPRLIFNVQALPAAILRVSLPDGTLVGPDSDPWLSEGWLLNLEGETQTFVVRINNTSASQRSYDTHLVIALNDAGYSNLISLFVNGGEVPKTAFRYGTPTPYDMWTWPSGDVYPTWFNDTLGNVGTIQRRGLKEIAVSVTFSNVTGARIHFDAWGKRVPGSPKSNGDITHNPPSADSTVLFEPGQPQPQPPYAAFSFTPTFPEVGEIVTFNASSSYDPDGAIASYTWDFGDGTPPVTESVPITIYSYAALGDYKVTLTVTDNDGLNGTAADVIHVCQPPVASFVFSPPDPLEHETVTFDASSSTPDGGTIISYKWDFGDGNITTVSAPIITHAYAAYGNYIVTLNVTDSEGKWDTESKSITVERLPLADFTWSPVYPEVYEIVTFNASYSTPDGGVLIGYEWDFGDGTPNVLETDPVITHCYTAAGDYIVTLNVTDSEDRWDTESKIITVLSCPPYANFTFTPDWPVAGEEVTFNATDSYDPDGYITSYRWDFGDGYITTVNDPIITHIYTTGNSTINYTVTLTVTDNDGLNGCHTEIVEVVDPKVLRVFLPEGTYVKQNTGDPWIDKGWLLNQAGNSWSFTVKIYDTSRCLKSYDTHLIVALSDTAYNNLQSLAINGTSIPKSAFQHGKPRPYGIGYWSDDVYPTWFNDTYINVGEIQPKSYKVLTVSVTFTDATDARIHFDAYGSVFPWAPCTWGGVTWSPHSEDSTVIYQAGPLPLTVSINPTSAVIDLGQYVTFTSSVSGGTFPYSYQWYLDGAAVAGANSNSWIFTPTSTGYYLVSLKVTDDVSAAALSDEADVTVVLPTYDLTIVATAGGTTDPAPGIHTYDEGTNVQVTAIPDPNYEFAYWELDGSNVGSNVQITVLMNSDHTLKAYFALITYTLTITATTGGTTSPAPGTHTYPSGSSANVEALPSANYFFDYWVLDGSPAGSVNPISLTMDHDLNLEAVFAETHTLIITVSEGGTTDPSPGTYTYETPTNVVVEAIPSAGYLFDYWEFDGEDIGSENPITVYVGSSHTLKAVFVYSAPPPLPSVSISPLSKSILMGDSVTFTSTVSGGASPYTYQWYLDGDPVSGATSSSWAFTPASSGIYYVYVKVTDANNNVAQSETARITATSVPVGGYSVSLTKPVAKSPLIFYTMLLAIFGAVISLIRRKRK